MRKPYLAGNWKMNLDRAGALELAAALKEHVGDRTDVDVAVCPPYVYVPDVVRALEGSPIRVGAQDVCDQDEGAFTGEVSAAMLRDVGATVAVVGHSERRHVYGEGDELTNAKLHRALDAGLEVILCVGETIEERQASRTEEVVRRHLTSGLHGVGADAMARVTIAYEPVWAIGTGHTATPEQAGQVHEYLRGLLGGLFDDRLADAVRIQYGGSVKPSNVAELMAVPRRGRRPRGRRLAHRRELRPDPRLRRVARTPAMIPILSTLLFILFVLSAIVLIVVILLQEGKGGGFGQALGDAGQQTFGVGTKGINTFTGYTAVVFLASALILHAINRDEGVRSAVDAFEDPALFDPTAVQGSEDSDG